jgi:hypothetical protein
MVSDKIHSRASGHVTTLKLWEIKDSVKNVYYLVYYLIGKTPGCGNFFIVLTTTNKKKFLLGPRLIVVSNGKNVKN